MSKGRAVIFMLCILVFTTGIAHCQDNTQARRLSVISGNVSTVDSVGYTIEITTSYGQMAFSVPDNAAITEDAERIGLMDINANDPVTIEYYSPTPGKYVAVSITCDAIQR